MDEEALDKRLRQKLRIKEKKNYANDALDDEIEGKRNFSVEEKLQDAKFALDQAEFMKEMNGSDFNFKYIQENGFVSPMVFHSKDNLGLKMPPESFSVEDVKIYVGARRVLDVIDTTTQQPVEMSMKRWVKYYTGLPRSAILNVISLEFSHTGLEHGVEPPALVRELDWVYTAWPPNYIAEQKDSTNTISDMKYPKVRKYCLMSVAGCFTDFHVDFGGTSVWYHILKGHKVFWLIPPTDANLALYEKWVLSGKQQDVFFGDMVEKCCRVNLNAGDTFLMPTGWIHAVFTPIDALVFGGNFLHTFSVVEQLRISEIESATKVPPKFRYPFYSRMMWYVARRYVDCLMLDKEHAATDGDETQKYCCSFVARYATDKIAPTETTNDERKDNAKTATACEDQQEDKGKTTTTCNDQQENACKGLTASDIEQDDTSKTATTDDNQEEDTGKTATMSDDRKEDTGRATAADVGQPSPLGDEVKTESCEPVANQDNEINDESTMETDVSTYKDKRDSEPPSAKKIRLDDTDNTDANKACGAADKDEQKPTAEKETPATCRPWIPVHLTGREHEGLTTLWQVLQTETREAPDEIADPITLLAKLKNLLDQYKHKTTLAANGINMLLQFDEHVRNDFHQARLLSQRGQMRIRNLSSGDPLTPRVLTEPRKPSASLTPSMRKRKIRCGTCPGCMSSNCGDCASCKDMIKFGGPGRMKQSCRRRNCANPVMPLFGQGSTPSGDVSTADEDENAPVKPKLKHPSKSPHHVKGRTSNKKAQLPPSSPIPPLPLADYGLLDAIPSPVTVKSPPKEQERRCTTTAVVIVPRAITRPKYVCRPRPITPPPDTAPSDKESCNDIKLPKTVWLRVLTLLGRSDFLVCMRVSRSWNRWTMDPRYWRTIDVSGKTPTSDLLAGVVRRQPASVDLSRTNISFDQLRYIIKRIPYLQRLCLKEASGLVAAALATVPSSRLTALELAWCEDVTDAVLSVVLTPPVFGPANCRRRSRLHLVEELDLTGCCITDATLEKIARHLTSLKRLKLDYCHAITDAGVSLLVAKTSRCHGSLTELTLDGCPAVTTNPLHDDKLMHTDMDTPTVDTGDDFVQR